MDDPVPTFWIGHHEGKQQHHVSPGLIQQAHASGYDLVTSAITTDLFHSRVLALLSSIQLDASSEADVGRPGSGHQSYLTVPPLSPVDTYLTPDESTSQIIATTSSWIDLCSPDPLVADVSKQVLMLEIAYAAFCGVSYVLIRGPRLHHPAVQHTRFLQFARAIQEVLATGSYMQVKIWFPMIDHPENEFVGMGDLAPFARPEYVQSFEGGDALGLDLYGAWDAWNIIRTFCKYHARLCVALILPKHLPPVAIQMRWYSEPIKLLTIDSSSFTRNPKGYPVLSRPHQTLINRYMRTRMPPWILLCNVGPIPGTLGTFLISDPTTGRAATLSSPSNTTTFPTPAEAAQDSRLRNDDPTPHLSYMRNLQNKQPPLSQLERFGSGYQDYLQAPLQPLTVNLESITYEVFEKDPVKYDWYEKAIARALHDWNESGKPTSNPDGRVVVAVVGAGRGPLVTRALRASEDVGVEVDMWALEKNPNAFVLLQNHNADLDLWANRVQLVKSDMRTWRGPWRPKDKPPAGSIGQAISPEPRSHPVPVDQSGPSSLSEIEHYPIDILISELLGSFADNELSPECLDGVQHLLHPTHGISIPESYTAHLTPIATPKLHADISTQALSNINATQTPYVVMLHAMDYLSTTTATATTTTTSSSSSKSPTTATTPPPLQPIANIQTAWSFTHPNRQLSLSHPPPPITNHNTTTTSPSNAHNARHAHLTFPIPHRGTLHGLAGYFETVLYSGVELSTNPLNMDTKSEGMISWFPIYFPLKSPLYIPDNGEVVVDMWRQTDERKVWYEWIVEVFAPSSSSSFESPAPAPRPHPPTAITSPVGTTPGLSGRGKGKEKEKEKEKEREVADSGGLWGLGREAREEKKEREAREEMKKKIEMERERESEGKGKGKEKGSGKGIDKGNGSRRRMMIRIAMSDLHSSVKEACLM